MTEFLKPAQSLSKYKKKKKVDEGLFNENTQKTFPKVIVMICFPFFLNINPLQPGVAYLYPLETSENLKVF